MKNITPFDFSGYCSLDWQKNSGIATDDVLDIAGREKRERSAYFAIMSHLSQKGRTYSSIFNDIRLVLLDRALCFMTAELAPEQIFSLASSRRNAGCVELLADIQKYKALENSGAITSDEKQEFEMLLIASGSGVDVNMRNLAELFDYRTLPQYVPESNVPELPDWLVWNDDVPLLWAKLLIQLPQEVMRSPGIDHSKVVSCAMQISRMVVNRAVREHMKDLPEKSDDLRGSSQKEYAKSLAYAWFIRFPRYNLPADCRREMQFLSDIWQLMQ